MSTEMEWEGHVPRSQTVIKLSSFEPFHKANCACGWVGQGVAESDDTTATPQEVIEALKVLCDHWNGCAWAWERGATGVVVYSGDSTVAIRYVLSADLSEIVSSERCRAKR